MNVQRFYSGILVKLLHKRKIATLGEMKDALGTQVDVTVFRKLTEVSYTYELLASRRVLHAFEHS